MHQWETHHDGFLLPPTPYTTQQSVCSLPVPVPWTYPDVAAFSIKPLNPLLHRLCALDYASYSSNRSKFSISSTSLLIRESVKQVSYVCCPTVCALSPRQRVHVVKFPKSPPINWAKFQNTSLPQAQQCQSCMKEALGAFCPMPVLYTCLRWAVPWPPAHHSGNSSLLQCCRTSDLQHHCPELSGGVALLWK